MILFLIGSHYLGNTQLTDPFGKVIVHEIKLTKLDNGSFMGAMEWVSGGPDSLQKFIVNGLDINAPVMVRLISKAPEHNIDLSFHKKKWNKPVSKISTGKEKFVEKIFRTMGPAGIGVSASVAGIPYLIIVKVGLQFPSTNIPISFTDDKGVYAKHLRKLGIAGDVITDTNNTKSNTIDSSNESSASNSNTLMYIIIGLLVMIILLLGVFLLKKSSAKTISVMVIAIFYGQFAMAQFAAPKLVPVSGQGDSPVFFEYQHYNVTDQKPALFNNEGGRTIIFDAPDPRDKTGTFRTERTVRINPQAGVTELYGTLADEVNERMNLSNDQFDNTYIDNMPGEETEGEQRVIPPDLDNATLNQLRRQVQALQQQVDLLSQEDQAFDRNQSDVAPMMLYCEDIPLCVQCVDNAMLSFTTRRAYLQYLQDFYLSRVTVLNDWIEYGNTVSSMAGGGGFAWGPILLHQVRPAMDELKAAYRKKFDEYIATLEEDLEKIQACTERLNEGGSSSGIASYEMQKFMVMTALKASKINL